MNQENNFLYTIEKFNYENNDTQVSILNIFNATPINSGKYKCIVTNLIGFAYHEIVLSYKSKTISQREQFSTFVLNIICFKVLSKNHTNLK